MRSVIRRGGGQLRALFSAFWSYEINPVVLGIFRIAVGIYSLCYYVALAPQWSRLIGLFGINTGNIRPWTEFSLFFPSLLNYAWPDWIQNLLLPLSISAAILLISGRMGKAPWLWLWWMNTSMFHGNRCALCGEEELMAVLFFYGAFLPLNSSFVFGKQSSVSITSPKKVQAWPVLLARVHLVFIYGVSLPFKFLSDPAWGEGTLAYYAIHSYQLSRFPDSQIFDWGNAFLSRILTYFTLAVEALFPLLIWFKNFRLPFLFAAWALHIGIGSLLEGLTFFNLSTALGLLLFLPGSTIRQLISDLSRVKYLVGGTRGVKVKDH